MEPVAHSWIGTGSIRSRFGKFDFRNGYPTQDAVEKLYELRMFNRAVEVYLAHIPAVSMFSMRRGMRHFGVDAVNKFAISEQLVDAKSLFLTANTETVYGLGFLDLKRDGPTMVEVPPTILGLVVDMWNRNLVDFGPGGPDKGLGGKYLFLPPDYQGEVPEGAFVVQSPTYGAWLVLRGFLEEGKPDKAVALLKETRCYPLSKKGEPTPMQFLNASGKAIDTIWPDNFAFFEILANLIAEEPLNVITPAERFLLASIGIEKGKTFAPERHSKILLAEAARVGSAMARTLVYASRDPSSRIYEDRQWEWIIQGGSNTWDSRGYVDSDQRAAFSYAATGNSSTMVSQVVGAGSQYFFTARDATGAFLKGNKNYRLRLPPQIPVKDFWSVVVYDALSRSELQNGDKFPSVSQYTDPVVNDDGSIDIYFGPQVIKGKEKNWIKTVKGKGWFVYLRFYGPLEPFFAKTWKPDDIVEWKEN